MKPLDYTVGLTPSEPTRLAVFGGSFDPVHNGHLLIAQAVVDTGAAGEVLFVPAGIPPHKEPCGLTPPEHRHAMLRVALAPYEAFSLSDIETRKTDGPSYTIDTLATLSRAFPGPHLLFLMGMDSLAQLHTWYRATELVHRFEFLVYPRPDVTQPSFATLAGRFGQRDAWKLLDSIIPAPLVAIAATAIRTRSRAGESIAELVPAPVAEYIRDHNLYGD